VDILKILNEAHFETPESFLEQLSPIVPRLYSIASCLQAHPGEATFASRSSVSRVTGAKKRAGLRFFFADHAELFAEEYSGLRAGIAELSACRRINPQTSSWWARGHRHRALPRIPEASGC